MKGEVPNIYRNENEIEDLKDKIKKLTTPNKRKRNDNNNH